MYRRGMTAYIGAAWRLKPAAMSISTMGALAITVVGLRLVTDPSVVRSNPPTDTILVL